METEIHENTQQPTLSLKEYAAHVGVSDRTVKRWIEKGEVPAARKDPFSGDWRFPLDAMRVVRQVVDEPAGGQELLSPANGHQLIPHGQTFWPEPTPLDRPLTRLERLDEAGGYLSVKEAAEFLRIPQKYIVENPEEFRLRAFGLRDSWRVPKAVIREIEGK